MTGDREASGDAADGDGGARSSVRTGTDRRSGQLGSDAWLYGWALGYAAVGAASLLIPLYAIDLGAGALIVSLIAATAAFAGVPGAILWGRLVTRTRRRRPFVLVALGLSAGVFLALPFLGSPWTVLAANAALWFVIAAAAPVLNVVVVEGYEPRAWAGRFGILNHYQGYGWLAGLVAGGVWSAVAGGRLGLAPLAAKRLFFVGSAVATLAAVLVVVARYPEPVTTSDRRFRRLSGRVRTVGGSPGRAARAIPYDPTRVYGALRDLGVGQRADSRRAAGGGALAAPAAVPGVAGPVSRGRDAVFRGVLRVLRAAARLPGRGGLRDRRGVRAVRRERRGVGRDVHQSRRGRGRPRPAPAPGRRARAPGGVVPGRRGHGCGRRPAPRARWSSACCSCSSAPRGR